MNIEKQRKTLWVMSAIAAIIYYGPTFIVGVYRLMHPQPSINRPAPRPKSQPVPAKPIRPTHPESLLAETPAAPAATAPPQQVYPPPANAPYPSVSAPTTPAASGVHYPPELTRLVGFWRGRVALADRGICDMHFELRAKADTDKFTGYSTLTCNSAGPLVTKPNAKTIT